VRRWRVLDLGATPAYLEASASRVRCWRHGVVVAAVRSARHRSRFSRSFEDQVAWLVTGCDLTAVADLMRVAWRSVGAIIARVTAGTERGRDRLADLRRIGIDEISYRRGQRYLIVVVDHGSGTLACSRIAHGRLAAGPQQGASRREPMSRAESYDLTSLLEVGRVRR
jgi:transposase